MDRNRWMAAVLLAALACGQALMAQPSGNGERNREGASSFSDRMQRSNQEFLEVDPKIGDPLPEVAGYDEQRNPVRLSDLKGSYSVIVFGCLT